jgi:hypothetical protein
LSIAFKNFGERRGKKDRVDLFFEGYKEKRIKKYGIRLTGINIRATISVIE